MGEKTKKDQNTKKKAAVIIALALLLAGAGGLLFVKGFGGASSRNNTFALVKMYMARGEYDRALDKLEAILVKNAEDEEALKLMDEIIQKKNKAAKEDSAVSVTVDTSDLTNVIESMKSGIERNNKAAEENSRAMQDLIKQQKEQAALEKQWAEEERKQQKLLEEQRKKEEMARKAQEEQRRREEEELKRKNAQVAKEMADVDSEIQMGKLALSKGDIPSALEHFANAKSKLPVSAGEPQYSAKCLSEMASATFDASQTASPDSVKDQLFDKAVAYAQDAVKNDSKDPASNYILGSEAMKRKDYSKALNYFEKAVAGDSSNYLYYYDLGRVQYMMKKFTEAKSSFTTSCLKNGAFAPARYNLGLTNKRLNDSRAALSDFRKAHDIDSHYEKAFVEEARVLTELKDYPGAIAAYKNALNQNSQNRSSWQELGSAYSQSRRFTEAEDAYRHALTMLPSGTEDPLTYYNLSAVLYELGKVQDSLTYAKKSYDSKNLIKDKSSQVNIIYNYALLCEKNGQVDEAISKYAEALQVMPTHIKSQINLGVMYMSLNPPDADMALSLFKKAYEQDKKNFEANNNLGSAYLELKNYKDAIMYFQNALAIDSKNNAVRINLAQAFASDGQYDNAKTTYLESLRADPKYWEGYIEIAKVCMALKDNESAYKYLLFVQSKNPEYKKAEVQALIAQTK